MSSVPDSSTRMNVEAKLRRQVNYWAGTVVFYTLSLAILWFEAWCGYTPVEYVAWSTIGVTLGVGFFYLLIRTSNALGLSASQLATSQGAFAIICIDISYVISGPIRGAMLALLLVVLVFCAFALERKSALRLSAFAVLLIAVTMMQLTRTNPVYFEPWVELVHFVLASSMLCMVAYLTGLLRELRTKLKEQKAGLAEALVHIQTLATRDELTSLPNRRYMGELLAQEERRRKNTRACACLAVLDIDWFKNVNDMHGHGAGDEVLRKFANEGKLSLRTHDVLARWGGEEFLLYLPETQLEDARVTVERFRKAIQDLSFSSDGAQFGITFSAGLIELLPDEPMNLGIKRADTLLYQAKAEGRNRVVAHMDASLA